MKSKKLRRNNTKKELHYDANIGHRLYVKSRGKSSKREQSIRKINRRKSLREKKETKLLSHTITMSENSKWILDKKAANEIWNDCNKGLKSER